MQTCTGRKIGYANILVLYLSVLLVACGGGGGSSSGDNNIAPVANAGLPQNSATGNVVTLDGSASSDANGDPLTYQWSLVIKPTGSAASLTGATTAKPTFTADVNGSYILFLSVSDGRLSSSTSTVTITANDAPVANAGLPQNAYSRSTISLDGSYSRDGNSDPLTFHWSFISKPVGSTAALSTPYESQTNFFSDVDGTYIASLVVNDGKTNSNTSTVTITVAPRYTKLDTNGLPLSADAASWNCVRDNTSGLIWEVKNTTTPTHLRYYKNGYTNYDNTGTAQLGGDYMHPISPTQAQIDAATNSIGFKNAVNEQGLCGAKDWRMPILEIQQLITPSINGKYSIDTTYFPDVDVSNTCTWACNGYFWDSRIFASFGADGRSPSQTGFGYFGDGTFNYAASSRGNALAVRLVRNSP